MGLAVACDALDKEIHGGVDASGRIDGKIATVDGVGGVGV